MVISFLKRALSTHEVHLWGGLWMKIQIGRVTNVDLLGMHCIAPSLQFPLHDLTHGMFERDLNSTFKLSSKQFLLNVLSLF